MKFLVVGCGSIGRRHIGNLKSLGAGEILAFDVVPQSLEVVKQSGIMTYGDLSEALDQKPDAVIVCTPPNSHLKVAAQTIEAGAHAFIEKPISDSLEGARELLAKAEKKKLRMAVGYNLRFSKGVSLAKELIGKGRIGKVLSARIQFGQYLPDWRPTQDYRKSYTAKKAEGGGIILDGSHEIDYARWLLGEFSDVTCVSGRVSNLEVETEDLAEITLRSKAGAVAQIHLDFIRRDYSRGCEIIGETGTIAWDYNKAVRVYDAAAKSWETLDASADPNDMYIEEMKAFIASLSGKTSQLATAEDGIKALEIALAAKKAAETGKKVAL
jgi:predicted dehydrogenase